MKGRPVSLAVWLCSFSRLVVALACPLGYIPILLLLQACLWWACRRLRVRRSVSVSYTHLTLPTSRLV